MKLFKLLFFSLLLLFILPSVNLAQIPPDDKLSAEAYKLARQAKSLWKDNKYVEAEKLYFKAWSLYPACKELDEFARLRLEIGDIKGANKVWNEITKSIPKECAGWMYYSMASSNFGSGDIFVAIDATIKCLNFFKGRAPGGEVWLLCTTAPQVIYSLGDKKTLESMLEIVKTMPKNNNSNIAGGAEYMINFYINMLDEKYEEAIQLLENLKEEKGFFFRSREWAKATLPSAYVFKGDFDKGESSVKEFVGKNIVATNRHYTHLTGLIAFGRKNYHLAIQEFSIYLNRPNYRVSDKFKYYVKRAEAYEAIRESDKAKKDYEAALIYNPSYGPAISGLARLEGRIVTERKTDKVPPQITITEPAVSRGLIVKAAGNDVMIKGIAADPGGLKSVTINGEKVYSQEGGTFWGNITLKEGMNKVTVAATDFSGNTGEQVFDIERPASAVPLVNAPLKEGRNFALLIGCQNYDDNNIPSLENPISDAIKLKLILKNNYNYSDENIFTLFNPERSDFKKQFLELNENILPDDNLVIFYAGHGIWVEKEKKGYWLLTEAKISDVNTWLSNKEVLDMIARLPARHTLLITDACFSGSVFKTRGLNTDIPVAMQQMNQKISRVAITSGNDTEVPDKSVFMKYLVKALSENKEKYLTAQKMFINQIIEAVMTETKTEPRYGTLELAGHVGGDYIFIKK